MSCNLILEGKVSGYFTELERLGITTDTRDKYKATTFSCLLYFHCHVCRRPYSFAPSRHICCCEANKIFTR